MNSKVLLLLHIFPREIDDVDNLANQLKVASKFINKLDITANIVLNLNPEIINWSKSKLPKEFIISKFHHILGKFDWCKTKVEVIEDTTYWGYMEQRVEAPTKFPDVDGYIFLDPDIILDDYIFYAIENSLSIITDDEFILSPQMYRFWDSSWDLISYDKSGSDFNVDTFDPYYIKVLDRQDIRLEANSKIKFAGGWFNYISKALYSSIKFPDQVKGYGPEDTFLSIEAQKRKAYQYIMEGIVVQENRKYLNNSVYTDYIYYEMEKLKEVNKKTLEKFIQSFNHG